MTGSDFPIRGKLTELRDSIDVLRAEMDAAIHYVESQSSEALADLTQSMSAQVDELRRALAEATSAARAQEEQLAAERRRVEERTATAVQSLLESEFQAVSSGIAETLVALNREIGRLGAEVDGVRSEHSPLAERTEGLASDVGLVMERLSVVEAGLRREMERLANELRDQRDAIFRLATHVTPRRGGDPVQALRPGTQEREEAG